MVSDPRMDEDSKRQATTCMSTLINFKPELLELPRFEDGPCADIEKLYTGAAVRVASQYGKQLTPELKLWVLGTPDTDTARKIVEYHGADRIGRHLQAHGIPMGVTTISKCPSFDLKMTPHQHLLTLFHHVVCSGGDPEVLVLEYSSMGVEAALAAGMQVFMVAEPRVD
ncbi:putative pseudouridine-5'-phosphatase [Dermacentor variabilis]|uniref:putative pseudouridine-5'-phosphatase n=1 Tax=Dermacentor variabilis TaxID=34621 RepID=UPI003F5C5641